jgi:plastin-1
LRWVCGAAKQTRNAEIAILVRLWEWNSRRKIDVDEKGAVDKSVVISALQSSGEATYDQARETLKSVSVDSSGKVELEDWVQLHSLLKQGTAGDV